MSAPMPQVSPGSGQHPVTLVVISANDLARSGAFYAGLFGWRLQPQSTELTAVTPPAGPMIALRAGVPEGSPGLVPYLGVPDVGAMLARVVDAGGEIEKAPWKLPMVGTLARFKDPSGTLYGLTNATPHDGAPHVPMPFGANPKPPAGALCSLEMHAAADRGDGFFAGLFGWSTLVTMPHYTAFDPGAGIGGVFQDHTPALPALGYVYTVDVAGTLAAITAAGGKPLGDPMALPGLATFGYFTDPSGTHMGLIGP
jgi:predicted enzyme related to lactoylglutathione lyase